MKDATWFQYRIGSGVIEYRYRFWPIPAYRAAAWFARYLTPEDEHRRGMRFYAWLRGHGLLHLEERPREEGRR